MRMKATNVLLTEEQFRRLREVYEETGVRQGEQIRRALDKALGIKRKKEEIEEQPLIEV